MAFTVPEGELRFQASRAGGPGGQHVNKTSTRIEVRWNVADSPSISDDQRARILERLKRRIDTKGVLRVAAGERRSQRANREAAVGRLNTLVRGALHRRRPRKPTRPSRVARERRLERKRRRSAIKHDRRPVDLDE